MLSTSFILGVSERAVMGLMGWSTTAMAARYQHITDQVRMDIAKRGGGLIWDTGEPASGESGEQDDEAGDGAAGVRVPA